MAGTSRCGCECMRETEAGDNGVGGAIAVLGAGSGGLAMAGDLALRGHRVRLWNRSRGRIEPIIGRNSAIDLIGEKVGRASLEFCTADLAEAVHDARVILVVTTADAHRELATTLAPLTRDGQVIVLSPGRTGGALEVRTELNRLCPGKRVHVAEAQTLVYACRTEAPGVVRIIGAKSAVPVAAYPASDTPTVIRILQPLFGCFEAAPNVMYTSFGNVGAILHPAIVLFNAATIERGSQFYFYHDMTPRVAEFVNEIDRERIALATAYGIDVRSVLDWMGYAYPNTGGHRLCERLRGNPAFSGIVSPSGLASRMLTEDIPTGLVPMVAFGQVVGLEMPLMRAVIGIAGALLRRDFWREGRTLARLGLHGTSSSAILKEVQ